MNLPISPRRSSRPSTSAAPATPAASTHLFTVGQAVRLKVGLGQRPQTGGLYHITGTLPSDGNSPQYRIRNDEERHERVTTQDHLEPAGSPSGGGSAALIGRTFRPG